MAEILTPDLCIIGAGAGGIAAAIAACRLGASVVLVERGKLGGANLNAGGLPSKVVVAAAAHAHAVRTGAAFGVTAEAPRVNFRKLHDQVHQVIADCAPRESAARLEALGITLVTAAAAFTDPRTIVAGETQIRARRFIIATGARPVVPAIPGLESVPYFTSETIFANTRKLTHLVIIGAGAMGLELAQAYNRLGTQVTVIEPGQPLPDADPELVTIALQRLQEEGVAIRPGTDIAAIQPRSQGIGVRIVSSAGEEALNASHILVATAPRPAIEDLGLEQAEVGRLATDPQQLQLRADLRTTNRRVYAIGDATGGARATHFARHQAERVVHHALFGLPQRQAEPLPTAIYTDPELAAVGLTEAAARARFGNNFVVLRSAFADNDRARALDQTYGVAKLLVDRRGRLLGAGIVGPGAGELAAFFALAIANRLSIRHLRRLALPHPTLSAVASQLAAEFGRELPPAPWQSRLIAVRRLLG